jgi:hypothetical protein
MLLKRPPCQGKNSINALKPIILYGKRDLVKAAKVEDERR